MIPLFFLLSPFFSFYDKNHYQYPINVTFRIIFFFLLGSFFLWLISNKFFKNKTHTSLVTTYLIIIFFSIVPLTEFLEKFAFKIGLISSLENKVINLSILIFVMLLCFIIIEKLPYLSRDSFIKFFFITGFILLLIPALSIFYKKLAFLQQKNISKTKIVNFTSLPKIPKFDFSKFDKAPNIYYFIVDAYARADVLKQLYNYDNTEFITFLQNKGFRVFSKSKSNYSTTIKSLPTTFNCSYFDVEQANVNYFEELSSSLTKNSFLIKTFKKNGYKYLATSSDYGPTIPQDAEKVFYPKLAMNYFERFFLQTTLIRYLDYIFRGDFLNKNRALFVTHPFKKIADLASKINKTFVFCHVTIPHNPFNFKKNGDLQLDKNMWEMGRIPTYPKSQQDKYRYLYKEQLKYTNHLLKITITDILDKSKTPPIIILQSDHGPMLNILDKIDTPIEEYERFSILNAMYIFGDKQTTEKIPENCSSVNTFRYIFNSSFNTQFKILKYKKVNSYEYIDMK